MENKYAVAGEQMEEENIKKKRWKNVLITILIIILLLLGWGIFYFKGQNDLCNKMSEKAITEEIGDIDLDARQAEVNRIVDESRIRMRINGTLTFKDGKSDNLFFQNMEDNDFPVIATIMLNDDVIYESGVIDTGKQVVQGNLNTDISPGEYKALVRYTRTDKGTYAQMEVMLNVI